MDAEICINISTELLENLMKVRDELDWEYYHITISDYCTVYGLNNMDLWKIPKVVVDILPNGDDMKFDTIYLLRSNGNYYIRNNRNTRMVYVLTMDEIPMDQFKFVKLK